MLFRVVKTEGSSGGLLGYEWVEVLASTPFALYEARREEDYAKGLAGVSSEWAVLGVRNMYTIRTELGLSQIDEHTLWAEIDQGTYCEDSVAGREAHKNRMREEEEI